MTHICIDDFAMRKGKKYGSLMVDINTNRIIDMIETRESEPVSEWLKNYPNLEVVSRDGSITYKNAIETAHPTAKQISDRFHLLKNLTKYAMEYLRKKLSPQIAIPSEEKNTLCKNDSVVLSKSSENKKLTSAEKYDRIEELSRFGYTKTQICKEINMDLRFYEKLVSMTSSERTALFSTKLSITHEEKVELKMERITEVRKMKSSGFSNRAIARRTKLDHRTVAKYIKADFNPVHASYGQKKSGMLVPYMREIDSMLETGMKGTDIIRKIAEKGYIGSDATVRYYISDWKKRRKHSYDSNQTDVKMEVVERSDIFKLLFHPLDKVNCISRNILEKLCNAYPSFQKIYSIVWDFRCLLSSKDPNELPSWLKKAKDLKIREINSFAEGIKRDYDAVFNAVKFDYSNGLAEGKVNKLKLIKRIMYGRSSFSTLKSKILLIENS